MPYKYKIQKAKDGQFYWEFIASNGRTMMTSERYVQKASARNGVESSQKNVADESFEIKESKSGSFSFNQKAKNGQVLGTGTGYNSRSSAEEATKSVQANAAGAVVEEEE